MATSVGVRSSQVAAASDATSQSQCGRTTGGTVPAGAGSPSDSDSRVQCGPSGSYQSSGEAPVGR